MNSWQTFDGFVVAPENQRGFELARRFAAEWRAAPALLLLQGTSPGGKTHLLHAIRAQLTAIGYGATVRYVPISRFANECSGCSREMPAGYVIEYYSHFDVLLFDEIELNGPEGVVREALASVCTAGIKRRGRIAFASRTPVFSADEGVRVATALQAELVMAELGRPGRSAWQTILERAMRRRGCRITAAALELLLTQEQLDMKVVLSTALCLGQIARGQGRAVVRGDVERQLRRM
ncbi:MAG: DnaA/Hda family protein [Opitutaceae bacterium]